MDNLPLPGFLGFESCRGLKLASEAAACCIGVCEQPLNSCLGLRLRRSTTLTPGWCWKVCSCSEAGYTSEAWGPRLLSLVPTEYILLLEHGYFTGPVPGFSLWDQPKAKWGQKPWIWAFFSPRYLILMWKQRALCTIWEFKFRAWSIHV